MTRQIFALFNLPSRDSDGNLIGSIKADIRGTGKDRCIQLVSGSWKITNEDIALNSVKDLGDTIAHLMELSMDAGFEQGRQHIKKALGIK